LTRCLRIRQLTFRGKPTSAIRRRSAEQMNLA
jgi:hypothetical protein